MGPSALGFQGLNFSFSRVHSILCPLLRGLKRTAQTPGSPKAWELCLRGSGGSGHWHLPCLASPSPCSSCCSAHHWPGGKEASLGLVRELRLQSTVVDLRNVACTQWEWEGSPAATPWHSCCLCSPLGPGMSVLMGAFKRSASTLPPNHPAYTEDQTSREEVLSPRSQGWCANHTQLRAQGPPRPLCCPSHCDIICCVYSVPFTSLSFSHPAPSL